MNCLECLECLVRKILSLKYTAVIVFPTDYCSTFSKSLLLT